MAGQPWGPFHPWVTCEEGGGAGPGGGAPSPRTECPILLATLRASEQPLAQDTWLSCESEDTGSSGVPPGFSTPSGPAPSPAPWPTQRRNWAKSAPRMMLLSVTHPRAAHPSQEHPQNSFPLSPELPQDVTGAKCTYDLGTRTSYRKTPACFFSQDLLTLYTSLFQLFSRVFFLNSTNVHSEYNILKCGISEGCRGSAFALSGHDTGAESVSPGWQGQCPGWWDRPQAFTGTDGVLSACFGRLPRDPLCPCAGWASASQAAFLPCSH